MSYLWSLLVILAVVLAHSTLHELSHTLVSKAIAPSYIRRFKPWPHFWQQWFYMGRVEVSTPEIFNTIERCYFYGAPLLLNSMLLFIYGALGGWFLFVAIAPLIDVAYWLICAIFGVPNNDGSICVAAWRETQNEYTRADRQA